MTISRDSLPSLRKKSWSRPGSPKTESILMRPLTKRQPLRETAKRASTETIKKAFVNNLGSIGMPELRARSLIRRCLTSRANLATLRLRKSASPTAETKSASSKRL